MIKNLIQKIVKRLSNKNFLTASLLPAIYLSVLASQAFLLIGSFSQGHLSEIETLRFLLAGSMILALGHFQYNQKQQELITELIDTGNQLSIENQAMHNSYEKLLSSVEKLDKQVLSKHGIYLQIEPKKKTIN